MPGSRPPGHSLTRDPVLAASDGFQDGPGVLGQGHVDQTADDSLTRAPSSSLSSRCHSRERSRTSCSLVLVRSRGARISGGTY
jgi:hypothetical protein